jgi:hypothetical protein
MLKKTIKYTDYNGVQREEEFLFHLSKAELMELEMGTAGGLAEMIQQIINSNNTPELISIFKKIILKAYGEKSLDGKRFRKLDDNGNPLSIAFSETEAYSELFMELSQDAEAAAKFIEGAIPADLDIEEAKAKLADQGILTVPGSNQ